MAEIVETFEEFAARLFAEGFVLGDDDLRLLYEREVYGPGLSAPASAPVLPLAPPA